MNRFITVFLAPLACSLSMLFGSELDGLLERSPFLPADYQDTKDRKLEEVKQPERPNNWELRGWTTLGGTTRVSMYDKAEKKSHWIHVDDPNAPIRVINLDATSKAVSVSIDGKIETIELAKNNLPAIEPKPQPGPRPAPRATPPAPPKEGDEDVGKSPRLSETKRRVIPRRRVVVPRRTN